MNNGLLKVAYKFISNPDVEWEQALVSELDRLSDSLPIHHYGQSSGEIDVLFLLYFPYAHESLSDGQEIRQSVSMFSFDEQSCVALIACGHADPVLDLSGVRALCNRNLTSTRRNYPYRLETTEELCEAVGKLLDIAVMTTSRYNGTPPPAGLDDADDMMNAMRNIARMRRAV